MRTRRPLLVALTLSFAVYLAPVVTPHWADLFGLALARELIGDRERAWKLADLALAITVQGALFAALWRPARRTAAVAAVVTLSLLIPATAALNVAYLWAIPARFLIEADETPDTSTWTDACTASGFMLDPVREGISRGLERRGEAWVRGDAGTPYAILRAPGCTLDAVALPELPTPPGLQQGLPDGSVVYVTMERGSARQASWLLRRGSTEPRRVAPPEGDVEGAPLIADTGDWAAWLLRSPNREASLLIESLTGPERIVFTHPLLQRATVKPMELDMMKRTLIVNRDLSQFAELGLDGSTIWGPLAPGPVAAQADTFRFVDGQWAGWDAYVEQSRFRAAWSTHLGTGQYDAPKGRLITSAALDRLGRYVAVSTTTALNIGAIRDTVVVISTGTGREVFRKSLPTFTRRQVAFLGDGYFAYSDINGTHGTTHVLRISE